MNAVSISIHAPVKGATASLLVEFFLFPISIHAPVKGATFDFSEKLLAQPFQSTLP